LGLATGTSTHKITEVFIVIKTYENTQEKVLLTCKSVARAAGVGGDHINPCSVRHTLVVHFQDGPAAPYMHGLINYKDTKP
jgi:hypothetical protein